MKIYMFHYVTENFNYYYFDKEKFEEVVKHLSSTKKIINLKQLKIMQNDMKKIDDNYAMLTFDDGTIDHYRYVYPILKKYNVSGLFFLCSNIINKNILDIQFIHQLLNKASIDEIYFDVKKHLSEDDIIVDKKNIEDKSKEKYVKQLIQTVLPQEYSKKLLEKLIKKYYISTNFENYYMSIENILEMKENKMEFGCHTNTHRRLTFLPKEEQIKEIKENMDLLYKNNILNQQDMLSIAYPFGDYNDSITMILNDLNFDFAFTTKEEDIYEINKYKLSRYDCNILKE